MDIDKEIMEITEIDNTKLEKLMEKEKLLKWKKSFLKH